jgi:hypothetical protein
VVDCGARFEEGRAELRAARLRVIADTVKETILKAEIENWYASLMFLDKLLIGMMLRSDSAWEEVCVVV